MDMNTEDFRLAELLIDEDLMELMVRAVFYWCPTPATRLTLVSPVRNCCSVVVLPRSPPADKAIEDQVTNLVRRAIRGHALGNAGHLFHEVD
jgi:hypothetical protein